MALFTRRYRSILCISDTHFPYHHPDTIPFLRAVAEKYRPDKVVHLGDELDHHALSFHDSDPDLPSAGDELKQTIRTMRPLYNLFPEMELLESNHGSLAYRKCKHHGIPRHYLRTYRDIIEAPEGWKWHTECVLRASNGADIYFHHGRGKATMKVSQEMGMSVVQGHYHNSFDIQYWGNPSGLYWAMQVGCSIDDNSLAFAYNKLIVNRPVIGHGIILEGIPKLLPLIKNKDGRWTRYVP